ncbi:MAG TPA: Ig-like domain-containing protein [Candidatus Saccharibacteria bacterium]|nr:Ig-like domain-containing protein [Candidatus Saccharibacteria bacterium]
MIQFRGITTRRVLPLLFTALAIATLFLIVSVGSNRTAGAACSAANAQYGDATSTITVPTAGTYRVWARMKASATDASANAFMIEIDGGACNQVGNHSSISQSTWTWVDYLSGNTSTKHNLNLTAGSHTMRLTGSEPGVLVDRVILTQDTACVPTGDGDNCASPPDTTSPTTAITSPASNASFAGNTTMNVTASASDDVGVTRVELQVDGQLVLTDTAAPYNFSVNTSTLSVGSHTLRTRAYDAANNFTTSSLVTVNITDATAPAVSLTAPANNSTQSGTITLSATATDNIGVARVDFLVDSTVIGSDSSSPYTLSMNTSQYSNGTHTLVARAYDAANNVTSSASRTITINNVTTPPADTTLPSVSITNPTANAVMSGTYTLSANATDNVGVTRVEFYVDGTLRNNDTTAPYQYGLNTTTFTDGAHTVYARAFDAAGNSRTSSTVNATIDNTPIGNADINSDGVVNALDFLLFKNRYLQAGASLGRADINGDGIVNALDFLLFKGAYDG